MMRFIMLRKLFLLLLLVLAIHTGIDHLLAKFRLNQDLWPTLLNFTTIAVVWALFGYFSRSIQQVVETLELGVKCFQDNDFSITIQNKRHDELGRVIDAYNDVAQTIRQQRMNLYQRELLLDTIIQQTPIALILTDSNNIVVYSNEAAMVLFKQPEKPDGIDFAGLITSLPMTLQQPTREKQQGLYSHQDEQHKSVYYLNCQTFVLNEAAHCLYLYKNMTTEISRQEIDLWKNAIRLMSHELNNSLAPIASLTNSAKDILNKPQHSAMLPDILDTISQRTARLHAFIEQYARFARLPLPSVKTIQLHQLITPLNHLCEFTLLGELPGQNVRVDQGQMEQVLINLLKNAKESASPVADIALSLTVVTGSGTMQASGHHNGDREAEGDAVVFSITDLGPGMSESQLQQALLPFFSTKQQGTGLGLTLCNEIVTAHGGTLRIANREGGGLAVRFTLPLPG